MPRETVPIYPGDWETLNQYLGAFPYVFNVTDPAHGAKGDGVADDTAAIQRAINFAQLIPGGATVYFPVGVYKISSTLTITSSQIVLQGPMRSGDFDTASQQKGATLRWGGANGGGPMIQVQPAANATVLTSGRIENLTFNGSDGAGNIAATGLLLANVFGWTFRALEMRAFSTVVVDMTSAAAASGIRGVVRCVFDNVVVRIDSGVPSAIGFRLDGVDTGGNTNHNHFRAVHVHYYNGVAFQLKNADTNWFFGCTAHRLLNGAGTSVEFQGSNSSLSLTARYNTLVAFSQDFDTGTGHGAPIGRGTSSYTFASHDNLFVAYTQGNANPLPTVETGATLRWQTDDGHYSDKLNRRSDFLAATGMIALGLEPATAAVPATGTIFGNGVYLYKGEIITNILVSVAVAGSGTAPTHIQGALWSSAASPVALAVSAEDAANARWTSIGWKEIPLSAPYTVLADGLYYASFAKIGAFSVTDIQLITGAANGSSNGGGLSGTAKRRAPTLGSGAVNLSVVNDTGSYSSATSTPTIGVN